MSWTIAFISLLLLRGLVLGVCEHVVERNAEDAGYLERHLERGRVLLLLDGDHGLTGDADLLGEVGLRHLAVGESQGADPVRDQRRLHHRGIPER